MSQLAPKTRDWESIFTTWSQGPSNSEQQRAENAERQIYQAIQGSDELRRRQIKVFTQGSYRNRVNIRKESDVDIGVVCFDSYYSDFTDDNVKSLVQSNETPSTYSYATFKNEVQRALEYRFGSRGVIRGDKAFQIDENTYRVNADVTPFFEHRRYTNSVRYLTGVQLFTDSNRIKIVNWPEQHYKNGVSKNSDTQRRYKRAVRILKTLRSEMDNVGITAAKPIPSFLVECLVWNVPSRLFDYSSYKSLVRAILAQLFNDTLNVSSCSDWGEVSDLKYLFRGNQPWTREQAHAFVGAAWNYVGYE